MPDLGNHRHLSMFVGVCLYFFIFLHCLGKVWGTRLSVMVQFDCGPYDQCLMSTLSVLLPFLPDWGQMLQLGGSGHYCLVTVVLVDLWGHGIYTVFHGWLFLGSGHACMRWLHSATGSHNWAELLRNHCILRVPNAKRGEKIRIGCLTPAFSGAHNWEELLRNPCILGGPQKGDKIRIGYLTPAFSGACKWAELLRTPCILGGPQTREQNQKWLPHFTPKGWRVGEMRGQGSTELIAATNHGFVPRTLGLDWR